MKEILGLLVFVGMTASLLAASDKAMGREDLKVTTSSVSVNTTKIYYTLPKHIWGMKFTAYCSNTTDPTSDRGQFRSADGKNYNDLILELKMDWLKSAMREHGTPTAPANSFKDWKILADKIVDAGGVYFPEIWIAPKNAPTGNTTDPEDINNINDGAWGVENIKAWFALFAEKGVDKLRGYEPYNEPATLGMADEKSSFYWYRRDLTQRADRKAADFAAVHQRQIAGPLMKLYPDLAVCGGAFSAPASSYGIGEMKRFIIGYPGWPWQDNNTKHMKVFTVHSYGYKGGSDIPTAPDGGQSTINSYFYEKYENPGVVSGYRAAVDEIRKVLDENGGADVKIGDSEWWAIGVKTLDPVGGSRSALGDVIGVILHCQNAAKWKLEHLSFHASNASPWVSDLSKWQGPEDCIIGMVGSKLYRPQRYYCIRDICGYFLNNYKNLIEAKTLSSNGFGGVSNNSVPKIQACAGLNGSGKIGILLMNTDTTESETIKISWDKPAKGNVIMRKLPNDLPIETPIPVIEITEFNDTNKTGATITLGSTEAALIEVLY